MSVEAAEYKTYQYGCNSEESGEPASIGLDRMAGWGNCFRIQKPDQGFRPLPLVTACGGRRDYCSTAADLFVEQISGPLPVHPCDMLQ